MAYSKEELTKLGASDIAIARSKIASLNLFDNIDSLTLTNNTFNVYKYTLELYQEYLNILHEFSKTNLEAILKAFKDLETIDNHSLESENPDLLASYNETHHATAINYLKRKLITENENLNDTMIIKAHEILMRGTSNGDEIDKGYRTNNDFFVGYYEDGQNIALYYPISYDEIKKAMQIFFKFYNSPDELLFIKAIISHGLLAALQIFPDGNTRLSRTIAHIKIFYETKRFIDENLILPAIYFSKSYLPYRGEYRNLIANLAINPNNENWNNWLKFNLYRMQDQIYLNETNLSRTKKK